MDPIVLVGVTTVIFGIASLLMISRARNRLSHGSIQRYMDNFAICLAFIVIFSLWQTLRNIFSMGFIAEKSLGYLTYPEYIFIVFAYIAFIITSYRIRKISEEFGFKDYAKKISGLLKEKSSDVVQIQNLDGAQKENEGNKDERRREIPVKKWAKPKSKNIKRSKAKK